MRPSKLLSGCWDPTNPTHDLKTLGRSKHSLGPLKCQPWPLCLRSGVYGNCSHWDRVGSRAARTACRRGWMPHHDHRPMLVYPQGRGEEHVLSAVGSTGRQQQPANLCARAVHQREHAGQERLQVDCSELCCTERYAQSHDAMSRRAESTICSPTLRPNCRGACETILSGRGMELLGPSQRPNFFECGIPVTLGKRSDPGKQFILRPSRNGSMRG